MTKRLHNQELMFWWSAFVPDATDETHTNSLVGEETERYPSETRRDVEQRGVESALRSGQTDRLGWSKRAV